MTKQPSVTQLARAERMRIAAESGAEARAHFKAQDIAVRKNMERLRAMRLAKEADDEAVAPPAPEPKQRAVKKRRPRSFA